MKTVYTLAALFALAAAQDASDIPSCALPCIEDAAAEVTDCSSTDFECLCGEIDAVREEATACVVSECGASTALNEVIPAVEAVCKAVAEGGSGGDDEPEEETPEEETPEEETPEEETPEEETPEEETPEEETPEEEKPEEEKPEEEKPEEDDHSEHDEPEVYPHPPTNETTVPEPEPEHPETAGAAAAGYMGVAAMVGIVALAL